MSGLVTRVFCFCLDLCHCPCGVPAAKNRYLDIINGDTAWGRDWLSYYACDPHDFDGTDTQKALVLGGHGCIWGEACDAFNLLPMVWPRLAATAERLWTPKVRQQCGTRFDCEPRRRRRRTAPCRGFAQKLSWSGGACLSQALAQDTDDFARRLHAHRCRLLRRGIAASPVGTLGDPAVPAELSIGPGSRTYCEEDINWDYVPAY
jgi:hypothetical protein